MINKKVVTSCSLVLILLFARVTSFAQCTDDTHSIQAADSWISCQSAANPNAVRGNSHWVMYDLGYIYTLEAATIWNYNVENETGKGFKDVSIDYSIDGIEWTEASQFELPQASGNNNYTGFDGLDFGSVGARYILITAQNNWNGDNCAGISEFRVEVGVTLPLELLHFSAKPMDDYISLDWESLDEINFSHFEIERSMDATHFTFIDKVEANGSIDINRYQLDDSNVNHGQLYYYRLKMVDLDGSYEYSPIRSARIDRNIAFSIYPNPTDNILNISFKDDLAKEIIIQNSTGHEILRMKVDNNIHYLDTSSFPSGMYLCSIVSDNSTISTKRFVKLD